MKKRLLSMLTAICLIFSSAAALPEGILSDLFFVGASAETSVDGFTLIPLEDDTYMITGYTGSETDLVIPSSFDGDSISSIKSEAFKDCSGLKSITIPDSITSIGYSAFENCNSLENINIPNSVSSIEGYVFWKCSSLTKIIIPDSIVSIGYCAFSDCSNLTSINIPDSVSSISDTAFLNCSCLESILVDEKNNSFCSVDGVLYDKSKNTLICFHGGKTGITIPNSVTSIGHCAFYDCTSLTSIIIPSSVTSISASAFYDCTSLTSIAIPSGVTSIDAYAFWNCSSLTSITIPNSVKEIPTDCFYDCTSLKAVIIPNGVTKIGDSAFRNCTSLKNIKIPDSVTRIDYGAFENCSSLESVIIPYGVEAIGEWTFSNCSSLTNVTLPDSVKYIGWSAFENCSSLKSIIIPDSVKRIYMYSFENCSNLTSISLGNNVTEIGPSAFEGCVNLSSITIPESVTVIGNHAFKGCEKIETVFIPKNVELKDDKSVFDGCTSLQNISVDENNERYCSINGVLYNKDVTTLICYPAAKEELIIETSATTINDYAFSGCNKLESIRIPATVKNINAYAFENCKNLTDVYIPNSVTSLLYTFSNCTNLKTVRLPKQIDVILGGVFENCTSLTDVVIPSEVDAIGEIRYFYDFAYSAGNFKGCINLVNVSLPDSLRMIGDNTFSGCSSLNEIIIPSSVEKIGVRAFLDCTKLNSITIPQSVTWIGEEAIGYRCSGKDENGRSIYEKKDNFIIRGYSGSVAELYAQKNGFTFIPLDESAHEHSYTSKVTKAATCTENGIRTYTCSCGDKYTESIKATGHSYTSKVTTAATCTEAGVKTYLCTKCGDMYTETINPVAHKYTSKVVSPTYTAQGYTLHTCSVCGYSYKDNYKAKLTRKSITSATVTGITNKTYTGKALTQTPVVKLSGKTLKSGTDYTVTYLNNKAVGTATVRITGKGSYTGTITRTFKIQLANVSGFKNVAVTANSIKFTWNKVAGADGYVVYLYNKSAKAWKRVAKTTSNTYLVSKLNSGEAYALTARAYKTVSGKEVLSPSFTNYKTSTNPAKVSFSVTSKSKGAVTYTWKKVTGATSYAIYYKATSGASWKRVATVGNTKTGYTKTGLKSGTGYFTVRAYRTYEGKSYGSAFDTKSTKVK